MKMLLPAFLLLTACAGVRTDGGQAPFDPSMYLALDPAERPTYAETVIRRQERDPERLTLQQLRRSPEGRVRKAALVVFETQFQPTRSGLAATGSNVYLTARGKQILTQEAWEYWDQRLRVTTPVTGVAWATRKELLRAKAFRSYGSPEPDLVLRPGATLGPQDVQWKNGGQKIDAETLFSPPNFQDVSLMLVPATELMLGPKPSEHQKHWVNDLCNELGVDLVLVVSVSAKWDAGGKDKRSGETIPEEMVVKLEASLLYPWKSYVLAGEANGQRELPKKNVPLSTYDVKFTLPVKITLPEDKRTFAAAENNVLTPLRASTYALSDLMVERVVGDLLSVAGD